MTTYLSHPTYIATHHAPDLPDGHKMIKASPSLVELQDYVLKRVRKAVKSLCGGADDFEYTRTRRGSTITFTIHYKGSKIDVVEWYTIKKVTMI